MDAVGLYPNISHGEVLVSLYKFLETRDSKQILSDTLAELAEIILKNNCRPQGRQGLLSVSTWTESREICTA